MVVSAPAVRLAQRIPVQIKLDDVPPDLLLAVDHTATVSIGKIRWWRTPKAVGKRWELRCASQ
jgi:hypothetical protein